MNSPYAKSIKSALATYGVVVTSDELEVIVRNGHDKRIPIHRVVQLYFEANPASIVGFVPMGAEDEDFYSVNVNMARPFIKVTKKDWDALRKTKAIYFETPSGNVVTIGRCESGTVIMPLIAMDASRLKRMRGCKARRAA